MSAATDLIHHYQHVIDDFKFVMGSKGAFELTVNGELLYSKHQTGRHANPGEVLELFTELVGPDVKRYER